MSGEENPHPWEMAGRDGKKKKERKKDKEDEEQASSSGKRSRRTHKEGGNYQERKELRDSKKTRGFTNVTTSTSSGSPRLGPLFKPPTLVARSQPSKALPTAGTGTGNAPSNKTIADKQDQVRATYSRMVQQNTGKPYEVTVYKKDRSPLTREDQWSIQFGISKSLVEASREGKTGNQIAHSGTRLNHRSLSVFCDPQGGSFYKGALNQIAGFEAFLPEDRKPGHEIFATLPGFAEPLLSRLPEHFAAATFGAVKPNQVIISRKAWRSDDRSSFKVYLELDDEAFEWLGTKDWMSPIGLYVTRWAHPPIRGISGYIRPDQNVKKLRKELEKNGDTEEDRTDSPVVETDHDTTMVQIEGEITDPERSNRTRHVTGEETKQAGERGEENAVFQEALTESQERELLGEVESPADSSTPKADRRKRGKTQSPKDKSKVRRRYDSSGNLLSDASSGSESDA